MKYGIIFLITLITSFSVYAESKEETAKYIGNLTWKLKNGIEIERDITLDSGSAFNDFSFAKISKILDSVSFDNTDVNNVIYSRNVLEKFNYRNNATQCGRFNFENWSRSLDDSEYIDNGVTLYSYSKQKESGIFSTYCTLDQDITINFQKNDQYYDDLDDVFWEFEKVVYLHNTLLVICLLAFLALTILIVKRVFSPFLWCVKTALITFTNGIAYFVGKIAEAIYTAKNKTNK